MGIFSIPKWFRKPIAKELAARDLDDPKPEVVQAPRQHFKE